MPTRISNANPNDTEGVVLDVLDRFRVRIATQALLVRLLALLALAVAVALLAALADQALPGGMPILALRVVAGACGVLLLAGGIVAVGAALRRRVGRLFAARRIEVLAGIRHNAVLYAAMAPYEPALALAAEPTVRQAAAALRQTDALHVGERSWPRALLWGVVAIAAGWAALLVLSPKPVLPSILRFLGANLPAPTATRIELTRPAHGDVLHAGEPATLEFEIHGRPPREVRLSLANRGSVEPTWRSHVLPPESGVGARDLRRHSLSAFEVNEPIPFRVEAGDGVLEGVLPVVPQPRATGVEVELAPPAYTKLPPSRTTARDVHALVGTRARVIVRANTEIDDALLVWRAPDAARTRMFVDDRRPREAEGELILTASGELSVEFRDRWGAALRDVPRLRVVVQPDAAPVVRVTAPANVREATEIPLERVDELAAAAADDIGLTALALVIDDPQNRRRFPLIDAPAGADRTLAGAISSATLRAALTHPVRAWFEALDNHAALDGRPAPQSGKSVAFTLVPPPAAGGANRPPKQAAQNRERGADGRDGGQGDEAAPGSDGGASEPADASPANATATEDGDDHTGAPPPGPDNPESDPSSGDAGESRAGAAREVSPDDAEAAQSPPLSPDDRDEPDPESESAENKPARTRQTGNDAGAEAGDDEFEQQLREFVQEHGQEAEDVEREHAQRESAEPSQPADDGANGRGERAESPPGAPPDVPGAKSPSAGTPQAAPRAADEPESAGGSEPPPDATSEPPGAPSDGDTSGEKPGAGAEPVSGEPSNTAKPSSSGESDPQAPAGDSQPQSDGKAGAAANESRPPDPPGQPGATPGAGRSDPGDGSTSQKSDETESAELKPPPSEPRAAPVAEAPGTAEVQKLLARLDRGERVDESELIAMGWPAQKAAAFVAALRDLHRASRGSGPVSGARRVRAGEAPGRRDRQAGQAWSAQARGEVAASEHADDALLRSAAPPEQDVPAHLRDYLYAYYAALARGESEQPGGAPVSPPAAKESSARSGARPAARPSAPASAPPGAPPAPSSQKSPSDSP